MIQVLPRVLLNSSKQRWYSLGRTKVRGKKSHLDASVWPKSFSRFFRCLFRFFTMRFLRQSWNMNHKKEEMGNVTSNLDNYSSKSQIRASPQTDSENDWFSHVPPCTNDWNCPWSRPDRTRWSPSPRSWAIDRTGCLQGPVTAITWRSRVWPDSLFSFYPTWSSVQDVLCDVDCVTSVAHASSSIPEETQFQYV